jgi:hypothetical protein
VDIRRTPPSADKELMRAEFSQKYKNYLDCNFIDCAKYIAFAAGSAVAETIRDLPAARVSALSDDERLKLRDFGFGERDYVLVQETIVKDLGTKAMGFNQLFDEAYRMLAGAALRQTVQPYSVTSGLSAAEFFETHYAPLIEAMNIPFYIVGEVDPNLRKFLPYSPVRSAAISSVGRRRFALNAETQR